MEEKEILKTLSKLRKIKPDKNWAFLKKREILGTEAEIFPFFKPVFAGIFLVLILTGIVQISQKTLPGEPLYQVKKITEKIHSIFVSEKERPKMVLELTQKRAKELAEIAKKNEVKKLPQAIKEFQSNALQAADVLVKSKKIPKKELQKVAATLQTVNEVERNLGTDVSPLPFDKAIENKVKSIIEDLEKSSLTEKQKEILESAKEDLKEGEIEKAFAKVMLILQNENE
jgi:hypothetical protein